MGAARQSDRFGSLPPWGREAVVALIVVFGGLLVVNYGWGVALWLLDVGLGVDPGPPVTVEPLAESVAAALLLLGLYGFVGLGLPYAYHTYREFDARLGLERPDRETAGWHVGVVGVVGALVVMGTLLNRLRGPGATGNRGPVPAVIIGDPAGPLPKVAGEPAFFVTLASVGVIAAALGVGVGGLFHGVLQRSLRQAVSLVPAVVGTAIVLAALFGRPAEPIAVVIVLAVGAVAGFAYERTGNLWVPIVGYAALNAAGLLLTSYLVHQAANGGP